MRPRLVSGRLFFGVWLISMSFLIFSLRLEGLANEMEGLVNASDNSDLVTYVTNMGITEYILPYHWREFIFWLGQRYLYQLIGNPAAVFIIFDFVLVLALYKSLDLLHKIISPRIDLRDFRYLYFAAFLFFPVVVGMHGVYRQILAVVLFLVALGYSKEKLGKGSFGFVVAFFVHNSVALLLPVFLLVANNYRYKKLAIFLSFFVFLAMYLVFGTSNPLIQRSEGIDVGQRLPYIYLCVLLWIASMISIFEYPSRSRSHLTLLNIIMVSVIIYSSGIVNLASQNSERIFQLIMALLFPLLGLYVGDRLKPKPMTRLVYLHLTLSPLLFMYSELIPFPF